MGRRIVCLLIVAVLAVAAIWEIRVMAEDSGSVRQTAETAKTRVPYRPNALISAMLLVLAGVSISMLFDQRK